MVIHVSEIGYAQSNQSLGSTRGGDKLDLKHIGSENLDNSPKITMTKSRPWKVSYQYYRI